MHYRLRGKVVRAENSAKLPRQASAYLVGVLNKYAPFSHALDFGCGKLRYALHLHSLSKRLTLVDSEIQLSRSQVLLGGAATIRDFVDKNWPNVRALSNVDFAKDKSRYDFVLCANVLSAIPQQRIRQAIVRSIRDRLTANGRALFVCQYTNSYFFQQLADKAVEKFGDGFIKGTKDNASFYGLIRPPELNALLRKGGLVPERAWINNQSGYVMARR